MKEIKNIRTEFRTDGNPIEVFSILTSDDGRKAVVMAMQQCQGLEKFPWFGGIELKVWNVGISLVGEEDYALHSILVRSKSVVVTIVARYNAEDFCESEELSVEDFFADNERFLLSFDDDGEVQEFDPEEGDDINDFDVYRAANLEEAVSQFKLLNPTP